MIDREIAPKVREYAAQYPVVTITGPRQLGTTLNPYFFATLRKFAELHGRVRKSYLVYGGDESLLREGARVLSWRDISELAGDVHGEIPH
jgi:predicted AAA+ superfamily ATPase